MILKLKKKRVKSKNTYIMWHPKRWLWMYRVRCRVYKKLDSTQLGSTHCHPCSGDFVATPWWDFFVHVRPKTKKRRPLPRLLFSCKKEKHFWDSETHNEGNPPLPLSPFITAYIDSNRLGVPLFLCLFNFRLFFQEHSQTYTE